MDVIMIMVSNDWIQVVEYNTMELCKSTLVQFSQAFENGNLGPRFYAFCTQVK